MSTGFSNRNQRLPQTDNNSTSIFGTALKNPGFQPSHAVCSTTPASCLGYSDVGSLGEDLHGYGNFMPAQTFQDQLTEGVQRFIGDLDANWRPFAWMQNEANVGVDLSDRDDWQLCKLNECANSGTTRNGFVNDQRGDNRNFSAKLVSNSSWQASPWANIKTTFGADYINTMSDFVASGVSGLPPGAQNVGQGAVLSGSNQLETANKTLGLYAQEQAGIRDRLFLTAAVRTDQNSAFGTQFQRVFYPKLSASWILSDENFFPHIGWLDQLRLRSAYGASGVQPGATTSLQTFSAVTRAINTVTPGNATGTDTPGLIASALGNPALRPEKSAEFESGFESRLFNNVVNIDFTYYNKKTHDALIAQPIAGSAAPVGDERHAQPRLGPELRPRGDRHRAIAGSSRIRVGPDARRLAQHQQDPLAWASTRPASRTPRSARVRPAIRSGFPRMGGSSCPTPTPTRTTTASSRRPKCTSARTWPSWDTRSRATSSRSRTASICSIASSG